MAEALGRSTILLDRRVASLKDLCTLKSDPESEGNCQSFPCKCFCGNDPVQSYKVCNLYY